MKAYFENKVVWITGASSGIGEALAEALAGLGARLILSARRQQELERVKAGLSGPPANYLVLPLDLEQPGTFPALVARVLERFGHIDVVIHSGGISQRAAVKDAPLAIDQKVMGVNFFGPVGLTKAVLPVFLRQQSGHFVVISSLVGKFGTPKRSAYSASKHALHGFFDSLRAEVWRDNIRVTLVCPGYVRTNISYNAINAAGEKYGQMDRNQLRGMAPETCAWRTLKAVAAGKQEVVMGGRETLGVFLKRFFPGLFSRIVRRMGPH
jgi:short-subunit dehydrogenase